MKLRSPNGSYEMTVPHHAALDYLRQGFTDVTPKRTEKQVEQSKKFIAIGTLRRTDMNLLQCQSLVSFTPEETELIHKVKSILWRKFKTLKGSNLYTPREGG